MGEKFPPVMERQEASNLLANVVDANRVAVRDSLINGHLRVAVAIAATYCKGTYFYPAEIYSEALFALTIAAERAVNGKIKHDNFKDYARQYIHGYVCRYLAENKSIVSTPANITPPQTEVFDDKKHDVPDCESSEHLSDKLDRIMKSAGLDELEHKIMIHYLIGWSNNMIAAEFGFSHTHIDNKRRMASEKLRKALQLDFDSDL